MSHDNASQCDCIRHTRQREERENPEKVYKGKLTIGDKTYDCEVRDGVRYIDGKTVDQFLETLDPEYGLFLARMGNDIIRGKKKVKN